MTYTGLFTVLLSLLWSCSDGDNSEFDGKNNGGSSGNGGGGGTLLLPDGGNRGGSAGIGPKLNTPVEVIITADNAYGFGYGTGTRLLNYFGGIENPGTDDIFACPVSHGPEAYTVPAASANAGDYLYIIGYADKLTTQGVIAKFSRVGGAPIYTGEGPWQACATGQDFDVGSHGPSRAQIDQQIEKCNAGNTDPGTTSQGWVTTAGGPHGSVAFGEDNSTERTDVTPQNPFKIVCADVMESKARWMWYDWDSNTDQSPFIWPGGSGNPDKEFLIFRLGAEFIPSDPIK
jgi:hypothetical protein